MITEPNKSIAKKQKKLNLTEFEKVGYEKRPLQIKIYLQKIDNQKFERKAQKNTLVFNTEFLKTQ